MSRRPLRLAALVAAAALVAGCQAPGTAAVVNGERITDREVTEFVEDQNRILPQNPVTLADGVTSLTFERIMTPVAASYDVGISDQQAVELINQTLVSMGEPEVTEADLSQAVIDVYRAILFTFEMQTSEIGGELAVAMQDAIMEADVEVNPRYGLQGSDGVLFEPFLHPWIAGAVG